MAASSPNLSSPPAEFHYDTTNTTIPQTLWNLRIPLFITHKNSHDSPFVAAVPRLSYLAQLLPRLSAFFGLPCSSFHHEEIQLRNLAVGLLVDLYQPPLPWRLEVGDGDEWDIGDTYLNCVKEVSLPPLLPPQTGPRFPNQHYLPYSSSPSSPGHIIHMGLVAADGSREGWADLVQYSEHTNRPTLFGMATQSRS